MNWDRIEGRWHELKGQARTEWAKLTDDDVEKVGGKREALVGALQSRYGYLKDRAERAIDEWIARIGSPEPEGAGRR